MTDILTIEIIGNGEGAHDDLSFSIPDLIEDRQFDTYYWYDRVANSREGDAVYLPIDFSDQYTGCLRVQNAGDRLALTYGNSRLEGWAFDPIDPGDYYQQIKDFEASTDKMITVNKSDFLSTLERRINKLRC